MLRPAVLAVFVLKDETRLDRLIAFFVVLEIQGIMEIDLLVILNYRAVEGVGSRILGKHTRAILKQLNTRVVLLNRQEMSGQDLSRAWLC